MGYGIALWKARLRKCLVLGVGLTAVSTLLFACNAQNPAPVAAVVVPALTATAVMPTPSATPEPTHTTTPSPTPLLPVDDVVGNVVGEEGEGTAVSTPTPTPTQTATATPTPEPSLNGIPVSDIIVMPDDVVQQMRQIYAGGQTLGRNPHAFSKLGDSIIANGDFLTRFDKEGSYTLGDKYGYLQAVIDQFPGSFLRYGVAIRIGLRAWGVFDPLWANKEWCEPNEIMIDCEFRLNNPSILIIHLGSNDQGSNFDKFLRQTVQHTLDNGVIPILLTKADRFEGEDNRNNITIRQVAADLKVPLVDFDIVAATLPNRGLKEDNVHLNGPMVHDYNLPIAFEKGHTVHNLTLLLMLDKIWQEVMAAGESR